MRIAIHSAKGSFSDRWIPYCDKNNIDYKIVNCYASDIMQHLADCNALMWHFNHKGARESKFAKQLLHAVQHAGKVVFPDFHTAWHFDDKVAQKYLLEGIGAPLAPSYVFYSKKEALKWAESTLLPIVFKLRNGAGSDNVKLVKSHKQAERLIRKAFGRGFQQYDAWANLKERLRKYRKGKTSTWNVTKGILRLGYTTEYARVTGNEKGYVYFQDFIPGNDSDIRVCVVNGRAFAIKRMVRENDFRASGSGTILYDKKYFDEDTIETAFQVSERLNDQCMAYDFVFDDGKPLIVEISYGFAMHGYDDCVGYWDRDMNWHSGSFNPYGWMVNDLIDSIKNREV
ncbi:MULTISPECIES: ATP-grasp domain-containing protein [unclassified Carboxylicivirga]|uniref:ATP-grasp domain-containing protein n=1 Tax=Carboxylicivirga TaxID=1628153 RepID=UPI003D33F64E